MKKSTNTNQSASTNDANSTMKELQHKSSKFIRDHYIMLCLAWGDARKVENELHAFAAVLAVLEFLGIISTDYRNQAVDTAREIANSKEQPHIWF